MTNAGCDLNRKNSSKHRCEPPTVWTSGTGCKDTGATIWTTSSAERTPGLHGRSFQHLELAGPVEQSVSRVGSRLHRPSKPRSKQWKHVKPRTILAGLHVLAISVIGAVERTRTSTPFGRYHLKVVRLPVPPRPQADGHVPVSNSMPAHKPSSQVPTIQDAAPPLPSPGSRGPDDRSTGHLICGTGACPRRPRWSMAYLS